MARLTYKDNDNSYKLLRGRECQWKKAIKEEYSTIDNSIQKLGKLEDLEEQLGCPIDVIIKAIKNGVWTYYDCITGTFEDELWHCKNVYFGVNPFGNITLMFGYKKENHLELSDYKKTWFLREDKSE